MVTLLDYSGRTVVVTGAFGSLGTAVIARLHAAGAEIVAVDAHARPRENWAGGALDRVDIRGGVDLREEAEVNTLYHAIEPPWASIHIAGGFLFASLADTSQADFQNMMQMNARTCFLCCRAAAARMTNGGRIVNIAARPGVEPRTGANMGAYAASKAAVAALTEALGEELAGGGILVSAVAPSILDTPQNRADMPDANHADWPTVEQVAETIAFLASPANKVTRSAVVPVYGRV
jgi:NAD(P)-dependent dehydrogenase (short-subunit alcohol dehydrogenase family)